MLKDKSEEKVLNILGKVRRYLKVNRIAQLSQILIAQVSTILDKFEKLRYVVSSPARKYKHPAKLIKEYLRTGRHPNPYENMEKEYKISRIGIRELRYIMERSNSSL